MIQPHTELDFELIRDLAPGDIDLLARGLGDFYSGQINIDIAKTPSHAIKYLVCDSGLSDEELGAFFGMGSSSDEDGPSPFGMLLFALLAPLGATLIQLAISRSREFLADEGAARLTVIVEAQFRSHFVRLGGHLPHLAHRRVGQNCRQLLRNLANPALRSRPIVGEERLNQGEHLAIGTAH